MLDPPRTHIHCCLQTSGLLLSAPPSQLTLKGTKILSRDNRIGSCEQKQNVMNSEALLTTLEIRNETNCYNSDSGMFPRSH